MPPRVGIGHAVDERPDARTIARFMSKVKLPPSGKERSRLRRKKHIDCWEWTACKCPKGYGKLSVGGAMQWAHRVAYAIFNGPIEAEQDIHHTCHNPSCVNPDHLRATSYLFNRSDGGKARHGIYQEAPGQEDLPI